MEAREAETVMSRKMCTGSRAVRMGSRLRADYGRLTWDTVEIETVSESRTTNLAGPSSHRQRDQLHLDQHKHPDQRYPDQKRRQRSSRYPGILNAAPVPDISLLPAFHTRFTHQLIAVNIRIADARIVAAPM